jgi:hypothetical protein
MKVEDAIKANELVTALQNGIEMQRVILEGLRDSLQEYNDFLAMQIRDMQRQSGERLIGVVETVSNCCGVSSKGEFDAVNRCSFCFEHCEYIPVEESEYER